MSEDNVQNAIKEALKAMHNAYAPYSNYHVGAAIITNSGKIISGFNIENAVYPLGCCAERVTIFKAITELEPDERNFETIIVATRNGGTPCGSCRQVLFEFAPNMKVIIIDENAKIIIETTVKDLLPGGFSVKKLLE